ncbi:MAG: hypothetical protein OEN23_11950 [Paracoccaceae bacterium]|nr:hypothetical protein [Paracoccaceae bacterium]
MDAADLDAGVRNLVSGCAEVKAGQRVLVVAEDPALGWYDDAAPRAVARAARAIGAEVAVLPVGGPSEQPPGLAAALADVDVAIFFAQLGDQDRFTGDDAGPIRVMSYARTADALASPYGRRDHGEMLRVKRAVDELLSQATEITIRCPLGTHMKGTPGRGSPDGAADIAIRRFPMCVPTPVSAQRFSGRVVLAEPLTSTGSQVYDPPWLAIPEPVTAEVENGRIAAFRGAPEVVARIEAHYASVAERFGIDADVVHSWHAGIHDACAPACARDANPDLWSNSIFGNPNYLHFHTCGDYPPGEICWMVAAPTIAADDRVVWREGALVGPILPTPG